MKTSTLLRIIIVTGLSAIFWNESVASVADAASSGAVGTTTSRSGTFKQTLAAALASFDTAQGDAAEKGLGAFTRSTAETPAWHFELACLLDSVLVQLRDRGNLTAAQDVIGRILLHLKRVVALAKDGDQDLVADAWEMTGQVERRCLGDEAAAEAAYRQALEVNARQSGAQDALNRMLASRAYEAARAVAAQNK